MDSILGKNRARSEEDEAEDGTPIDEMEVDHHETQTSIGSVPPQKRIRMVDETEEHPYQMADQRNKFADWEVEDEQPLFNDIGECDLHKVKMMNVEFFGREIRRNSGEEYAVRFRFQKSDSEIICILANEEQEHRLDAIRQNMTYNFWTLQRLQRTGGIDQYEFTSRSRVEGRSMVASIDPVIVVSLSDINEKNIITGSVITCEGIIVRAPVVNGLNSFLMIIGQESLDGGIHCAVVKFTNTLHRFVLGTEVRLTARITEGYRRILEVQGEIKVTEFTQVDYALYRKSGKYI